MTDVQKSTQSPASLLDQRTAAVKEMMAKEARQQDEKTARLRALRLAKEAERTGSADKA